MKRSQLLLATIALPLDYLMLMLAGILAYQLRFVPLVREFLPVVFQLPLAHFIQLLLVVALVWVALFALAGLYAIAGYLKFSQEVGRLFLACTAGLAIIIILFFFNPLLFSSRFIVLAGWGMAFVLTSLGRFVLRSVRVALYRRGLATTQVVLVGGDQATLRLEQLFRDNPALGHHVLRRLTSGELSELAAATVAADEVIIGEVTLPRQMYASVLEHCTTHHLGFRYVADMFEAQSHNVVMHTLAGLPLIEIKRTPLDGWGRVAKRLFDLVGSLLLMVLLSPIFVVAALLIMVSSGGPVVVVLERIGENGQPFRLYKFRSMVKGAQALKGDLLAYNERPDGPLFKMANDPRVTPLGKFLRASSLDELPQFWNVLKGEMSLVGPRPHEPAEVAQYQLRHHKLLNLKPGLTGLAQISGRSNLSFEDEARLDTFYVENWSLGSDLIILIKTIVVVWQRQAAV